MGAVKHGTQDVWMVNKVRKYLSMCEMVASVHAAIETHKEEYFVEYQDISLAKPMDSLKYGEHQLDNIWRWVCWSQVYGQTVTQSTT